MQTKYIISLLVAAVGINAAPSVLPRADSVPISVYDGRGCNNNPVPLTTANVPTDGQCFGISPIVSGNTDSFRIEANAYTVPAGCTITAYTDADCTSTNFITVTQSGQCFTFGPGLLIRGAIASGTC